METRETPFQKTKADLNSCAANEGAEITPLFVARMFLLTPGFQFVFARRLQEFLHPIPLVGRLLRRMVWWATCITFGSELAIGADIGGGLYIPHPFGIVVGVAKIGRNVSILQNVTIGRKTLAEAGDPTIEDGVIVSAGAVILGAITLGQDCTIGANSVVLRDVPRNALAIGVPARIATRRQATSAAAE